MSTHTDAQNIDVGSVWSGVRRALPALLLCTLAAGGLTFAALTLIAPRYESESQVTITAKSNDPYRIGKDDAGAAATVTPRLDPAAINTHVRAIQAPDLLLKVGNALKLGDRAEFNPAIGPLDTMDRLGRLLGLGVPRDGEPVESRVLAAMRRNLSVSAARESRFISIRFTSVDPQLAADVANGVATAYRSSLREIPVRETNEAVAVLTPKIEQLSREVLEAEAIAKRFRAESDQLTGGSTFLTLQQQRLSTLNVDLVKAEADLTKANARLEAAKELATRGSADTLPEVQQSRIIQDLMAQKVRVERQVNEAQAVLLPAHPRMRQLNADLSGLRRTLDREISTIVSSIQKEVQLNERRTEQLRDQVAALKDVAVRKSGDEARLRALETTAQSKRNELERLQKQLEDNRTVVDTNRVPVEATIVSAARVSGTPVFPQKGSSTILAMAATFMLGLSLVIARGLMLSAGPVAHNRRAADKVAERAAASSQPRAARSVPSLGDEPSYQPSYDAASAPDDDQNYQPSYDARAGQPSAIANPNATARKKAGILAKLGALSLSRKKSQAGGMDQAPSQSTPSPREAARPGKVSVASALQRASKSQSAISQVNTQPNAHHVAPGETDITRYADRFMSLAPDDSGYRLLIAGATDAIDPTNEAIELVAALSDAGAQVLLIDWSLSGDRVFKDISIEGAASLADLIAGVAEFEDIIVPLPDSNVHYVYSTEVPDQPQLLDPNGLNLVFDALDEAYDFVVITGRFSDACSVFEAIEGRFDAGLSIAEASVGIPLGTEDNFLGFAVTDIEIVHHVRSVQQRAARVASAALSRSSGGRSGRWTERQDVS